MQVRKSLVHSFIIAAYNLLAALLVRFFDCSFNGRHRPFDRQDAGDGKKGCLHNGVDAASHAGIPGDAVSVNGEESHLFVDQGLLDFNRKMIPDLIGFHGGIEKKCASR